ncbi:hypothetical protein L1049_027556 [Liquidambar formosana]|uniref:RNase H type-1 domain-containing protein n=1 Tax=Liquidambar formosana TaxID=63359 RepID=A0AAP0RHU6_LIQFO
MTKPSSMLARLHQGKYYHKSSFLEAKVGNNPLWAWRSLLEGRKILQARIRWRIGNGKSMPVSWMNRRDKLRWHYTSNGRYSVKSGYAISRMLVRNGVLTNRCIVGECSRRNLDKKFWKFLWGIQILGKLHHFLWKCAQEVLPVGSKLGLRVPGCRGSCPFCGEDETIPHLFFYCQFARVVWYGNPLQLDSGAISRPSFIQYMEVLMEKWNGEESWPDVLRLMVFILWRIWKARNDKSFAGKVWSPGDVISKALVDALEYNTAVSQGVNLRSGVHESNSRENRVPRWCPSIGSLFKINTDGAWVAKDGIGGVGIVIRDERGMFIAGMAKKLWYMGSAQIAEALALREGLQFALDTSIKGLVVETDAKGVIEDLKNSKNMLVKVEIVNEDIKQLAREACCEEFSYAPRKCNRAADAVAKFALRVAGYP